MHEKWLLYVYEKNHMNQYYEYLFTTPFASLLKRNFIQFYRDDATCRNKSSVKFKFFLAFERYAYFLKFFCKAKYTYTRILRLLTTFVAVSNGVLLFNPN